ncbi:MAG: hypothetical protein ACFFGZ_14650 [Candidatus Thorarchaeota archaeon]
MSLSERLIRFWEDHPRIELMIFAFALHGILAPFTGLDHDIGVWLQVSDDLIAGRNPYVEGLTIPEYYAYPPLWAYILLAMRLIANSFGNNVYIQRYMLKLPMILTQIGTAWLAALVASKERSEKQANEVFAIILLNPYFYLIGSIWGIFDIIPAFFTLATVYAIMDDPVDWESPLRPIIAGICLSVAVLAKLYPVILFPLCLIHLRRKFHWLSFSLSFGIAFALVCAPFFFQDPDAFLAIFEFHASRIGGGITYWNGLWLLIGQGEISEETAIEWSGYYIFLFVGALLITYLSYWRGQRPSLLTGACLVVWVFAFAFKLILEQYCVWILTFTIAFLIIRTDSRNLRILGSLAIILIPTAYLIISVPLPDLFYVDVIREQRDLILSYSFYERQQILFLLGCLFAGIHFLLWLIGLKEIY